jgi:hypothetical protein
MLWKAPLEPGSAQPLKLSDERGFYSRPAISPDGKWIACFEGRESLTLTILPFEGGEPVKSVQVGPDVKSPTLGWSARGDAVIYLVKEDGINSFWQWRWRSGSPERLADFGSEEIYFFDWSKEGDIVVSKGAELADFILFRNF